MGNEVSRGSTVTRACWRFVDLVSQLLAPDDRDAVCGDFTESGVSGGQALREVLGLIVRRQAVLWADWRPWLAIVGVVAPLGLLLSYVSRWWADNSAIAAWLYVNNWTWGYLESPGARGNLVAMSTGVLADYLALIGWSWTSGFVLGSLSRRTQWFTGTLFCLVVLGGTVGTTSTARAGLGNAAVFSVTFYRVVFPWLLRIVLVLLPALCGMYRSGRQVTLALLPTILAALAVAILTAWTAKGVEGSLFWGRHVFPPDPGPDGIWGTADDPRPLRPLPLLMVWPMAYVLAISCWQRWRGQRVSA
jgi:hypothetical protein